MTIIEKEIKELFKSFKPNRYAYAAILADELYRKLTAKPKGKK